MFRVNHSDLERMHNEVFALLPCTVLLCMDQMTYHRQYPSEVGSSAIRVVEPRAAGEYLDLGCFPRREMNGIFP